VQARVCLLLAWITPPGLAVAVAGCAATSAEPVSYQIVTRSERAETVADRWPAQVAPPVHIRQLTDEPSQTFSRNYAPVPAMRLQAASVRMTDAEADALIARAITEHEMRRP
jgi:hypothetical protein